MPPNPSRFLNPYNFVRPLPDPASVAAHDVDVRLLGRCVPPPHDRYVGLTGRITCSLTTCSPVFVSDSYSVQGPADGHRSYRFYRDGDGVPAIPGSTLRGVVRSVFEAATSSCWELVSPRKLSRRMQTGTAAAVVPGRLVRGATGWQLELLNGDSDLVPTGPVADGQPLYAAWVPRYDREGKALVPRASRAPALGEDEAQAYDERGFPTLPAGLKHGFEGWARLRLTKHSRAGGGNEFFFWNVEALGTSAAQVSEGKSLTDRVVAGYYSETGFNINRKHDERFFFTMPGERETLEISRTQVQDYVALLEDYRELHGREKGTLRADRTKPSRFVVDPETPSEEACDKELVYAWLVWDGETPAVKALAPVAVPRLFYERSIRDRFPAHEAVKPCTQHNRDRTGEPVLCPACRMFGWVAREQGPDDGLTPVEGRPVAWRSRVRFGGARFPAKGELDDTPRVLDILSSPKPTTVRFYLMPRDPSRMVPTHAGGKVDNTQFDYEKDSMVVRGRKFYRTHRKVELHPPAQNSAQNRTLREWMPGNRTAEFKVRFECLAPVELGALLWALEQQPGWRHRLGYGKPLGLGSVQISVVDLAVDDQDRYAAAAPSSEPTMRDPRAHVEPLKECFRSAMKRRFGKEFESLPNVADLRAILSPASPDLEISYPNLREQPYPESFHWFVVNNGRKYRDRSAQGRGFWLPLAAEDRGLPFDPSAP
ncbi:MAG: hypothetical protein JWM27_1189 [Gemmatimonadetes bacterium]|nr:hypothetical protein [Gemmatimonadota bacterium]